MSSKIVPTITRRGFLKSAALISAGFAISGPHISKSSAKTTTQVRLKAGQASVRLAPEPAGETAVWCYNGSVPGPEIRVRQGDRLQVIVDNALDEQTTVHWHGVRVPNGMDGVPDLTQPPIEPGGEFLYEFDAVDAGTFWYHPHQRGFEQVGRGLYGPLIIEEREPLQVDREVTWVLDDWRLTPSAAISDDFGNAHDISHSGRIGNSVTINGRVPDRFTVHKGERIRLRLINAANARIFGLDFQNHDPIVVALDGQPVTPHAPDRGLIVLGPAMRADVVLDMKGEANQSTTVIDRFYKDLEYRLVDLAYSNQPLRSQPPDWSLELPANPIPEPDLNNAIRHRVVFNGGMMGGMVMQEMGGSMGDSSPTGMMGGMGSMMGGMHSGNIWFINGVAAEGHILEPMLTLEQNRSHVIAMTNATAWHHPIHFHGHSFRVISRNGTPTTHREWQDTVLMAPKERVDIALVADNPGDWMFHCHILEHMAGGMMGVIRVA
ncbi:multicopper oxidase family protein [uncultured Roseovarius sp.]|uniref:multicopper oxidase family protein n=1 Tax=uncultured Roseovarius sp. TaxID=293344 RepID=UPI002615A95A|nr:multicopper oxidase family protein [uncultured Roseovarius sp.]